MTLDKHAEELDNVRVLIGQSGQGSNKRQGEYHTSELNCSTEAGQLTDTIGERGALTRSPVPSLNRIVSQIPKRLIETTYKHSTSILRDLECI
jgi:hypothetical protein